jgi:hypothetical protein
MILTLLVLLCPRLSAARVESFFFQQQDCVQEKLYLTTDRPTYEAGDTVWFSGTLVSADNLSYLLKSNYIYAELIDEYGVVLQRRKVKREGLCFQHNFPLDKTLTTGRYTLRAYTSWMRNFGEALFYAGTISVRNPELPAGERPLQPYDVEVTFCPEGGALLAGQRQWVAFRAVGNDGRPAQVTGTLRVGAETIAFSSTHDGMGRVLLSAVPEVDSLVVQVQTAPGERPWQQRLKLPVARRGRALAVESPGAGDSVRYQILTAGVEDDSLLLVLHSGARLVTRRIVHGAEQGVLDLSACRVGVNQLLLCGADGVVYARRLLFRYPAQEARLALTASPNIGASVAPRSPLRLDLTLTDEQGRPLAGDFSVSVLDGDFVTTEQYVEAPTLQSHLLLSSDLHGRIYRPAQYFDAQVPRSERRQWLDLVMMTHGWSRFATDTLAPRSDWQMAHPLEEHEWVSGRITRLWDRKDRNRLERIPISIVDTSGHSWGTAMLDTAGYFFVGDLDYPLGTALMVRILSYSSKPHYHFDRPSYPEVSAPAEPYRVLPPAAVEDSAYRVWLRQLQRGDVHLLDEVVVTEKLPGFGAIRWREQVEAQLLSQEYDQYTFPKAMDLVNEVIRTRGWRFLDEVDVFEPGQKGAYAPHLVLRNVKHRMYSPVEALQKLYSVDILKIDLVRRHESYVIVTFKPGTELSDLVRNRRHFTYYAYGYQQPEYFYHPRYETEEERLSPTPDLRRTLYWNPSLQPDAAGQIALSFYTADHTLSRCLVHVEGVTFDGRPVSLLKEI